MFILKACPRCGGDLFSGVDDELTCMQCGKDVGAQERKLILQRAKPLREPASASSR
jgi:hypothetical protein